MAPEVHVRRIPAPLAGFLLLSALAAPAVLAGPPRSFPPPAPQSGDTEGCPSVAILSRRFSFQNDANGGGYGYYPVSWDDNRQPTVVRPAQDSIRKLVAGELAGPPTDTDEKLRLLWGTRCAYPDLDYVKEALETVRATYVEETGVTLETEARWHKLKVDVDRYAAGKSETCAGRAWPEADPERGLFMKATCGGFHNDWIADLAFRRLDHDDPSPLYRAAVVGICGEELHGDGVGAPAGSEYFKWRQCLADAEQVDRAALDAWLADHAPNVVAATAFEVWFEKGLAKIDRYRAPMAATEASTPAVREAWETTVAKVQETWSPALRRWRAELDALDVWEAAMGKNPSQPGTCEADLTPKLQAYVREAAPGAKGETLLQVLKDPVGYRFTAALTLCHQLLGHKRLAATWRDTILTDGVRVEGEHQGVQTLLIHNAGYGNYKGQAVPLTPPGGALVLADEGEPWIQRTIGRPTPPDQLVALGRFVAEKVAAVSPGGETTTLTFVHRTGKVSRTTGCQTDYSKLLQIDEWGYLHYAVVGCRSETVTVDMTHAPTRVPAWEARVVKAGDVVYLEDRGGSEAQDLDLAWVKRGADVIWAAGVQP